MILSLLLILSPPETPRMPKFCYKEVMTLLKIQREKDLKKLKEWLEKMGRKK